MRENKPQERLLIIAPVGQDAGAMASLLHSRGFKTQVCEGSIDTCQQLLTGAAALLLTEEALELPEIPNLFESLRAQPPWSELPLIILTSGGESRVVKLLDLAATAAG